MTHPPTPLVRYIALLRAINVGGHTVKMEKLRQLFGELEFAGIETFIASGNVIFEAPETDAPALERRIEGHLHSALGYAVATFLRTTADLAAVAAYQPFPPADIDAEDTTLYIGFLPGPPSAAARTRLLALGTATDTFHVHKCELYWLCRTRLSDSSITGARLEKTLGLPTTLRNVSTVRKLAAKYPPPDA
jgi:uncharacterized protein (DUF1697 family)